MSHVVRRVPAVDCARSPRGSTRAVPPPRPRTAHLLFTALDGATIAIIAMRRVPSVAVDRARSPRRPTGGVTPARRRLASPRRSTPLVRPSFVRPTLLFVIWKCGSAILAVAVVTAWSPSLARQTRRQAALYGGPALPINRANGAGRPADESSVVRRAKTASTTK